MTIAYVGKGLPKFTKKTLIEHCRKCDEFHIQDWTENFKKFYRIKYDTAPRTFDALDVLRAFNITRGRYFVEYRRPCVRGFYSIFCQMLTPEVASAIHRRVRGCQKKITQGRHLYNRVDFLYHKMTIEEVLIKARGADK